MMKRAILILFMLAAVGFSVGNFSAEGFSAGNLRAEGLPAEGLPAGDLSAEGLSAEGLPAGDVNLEGRLIDCFDFSPQSLVEIATPEQLYLVGSDKLIAHGKRSSQPIRSFVYLPDSCLMIARDGEVCSFDVDGNIVRLIGFPFKNFGISSGKHVFYVYERSLNKKNQALYMIARGGKYQKLMDLPAIINDLLELESGFVFATDDGIFEFSFLTRKITPLVKSPKGKGIMSVVAGGGAIGLGSGSGSGGLGSRGSGLDGSGAGVGSVTGDFVAGDLVAGGFASRGGLLFYSTDQAVYALYNGISILITDKIGGRLKYFGGAVAGVGGGGGAVAGVGGAGAAVAGVGGDGAAGGGAAAGAGGSEVVDNEGLLVFSNVEKVFLKISRVKESVKSKYNDIQDLVVLKQKGVADNAVIVNLHKKNFNDDKLLYVISELRANYNLSVDSMIYLSEQGLSQKVIMAMRKAMRGVSRGASKSGGVGEVSDGLKAGGVGEKPEGLKGEEKNKMLNGNLK